MNEKAIEIRKAKKSELPVLNAFQRGIIEAELPFNHRILPDTQIYYDLSELMESPDADVIVGVCEDEIVASAYVKILDSKPYLNHDKQAYLGFMYVKPSHRGQGLNRKVMDFLKDWATSRDVHELQLDVYTDNASAIKAYKKAGFEEFLVTMRMHVD
ncbi:GNAT family N-acetyltransferase [Marinilongibacter aquaticus]|uniref:GNAT family N-acetyltransferase n=1 Tax=Marinilongibacter aquaticus TaxID=2975157 RepID=UPI0021BD6791|nr:GNAT family N-acetyltransferase [Marinilongibacter aquaticus]UBM60582.1 GNAT family N-acetyltransferase [Marinilongibacter aquaticus]